MKFNVHDFGIGKDKFAIIGNIFFNIFCYNKFCLWRRL